MRDRYIKRWDSLLQNIAAGLCKHERVKVADLEVVFHGEHGDHIFSVACALDYLANDIYWNEDGNWSEALTAEVRVI